MGRDHETRRNPEEERRAYVEELTRRFCDDYGSIDGDAVRLIVENAVVRDPDENGSERWRLELSPSDLQELHELFPLETRMRLASGRLSLPSYDPGAIFCNYINDPGIPYYFLGELADLTEEMGSYLQQERQLLLETGYPSERFGPSLFLDRLLGNLLPVRLATASATEGPLIDGFSEHDVEWVSTRRSALLEAKLNILRILVGALRTGSAATLRKDVLTALGGNLNLEDWQTFNRIESLYDLAERTLEGSRHPSELQQKAWARPKRECSVSS